MRVDLSKERRILTDLPAETPRTIQRAVRAPRGSSRSKHQRGAQTTSPWLSSLDGLWRRYLVAVAAQRALPEADIVPVVTLKTRIDQLADPDEPVPLV